MVLTELAYQMALVVQDLEEWLAEEACRGCLRAASVGGPWRWGRGGVIGPRLTHDCQGCY